MPLALLSFYSTTLGLSYQADVILPQRQQGVGQAGSAASVPCARAVVQAAVVNEEGYSEC